MLPDGAVIEVDGGAGLTRALADAMPATARTLDVAIGLPQIRDGAENYDGELARYRTVKRAGIVDLAAGRSRVDLGSRRRTSRCCSATRRASLAWCR